MVFRFYYHRENQQFRWFETMRKTTTPITTPNRHRHERIGTEKRTTCNLMPNDDRTGVTLTFRTAIFLLLMSLMLLLELVIFNSGVELFVLTSLHWNGNTTVASKTTASTKNKKDIVLMTRTYAGDRWRAGNNLLHHLQMFYDLTEYDFTFVLDDESSDDHLWGQCLEDEFPETSVQFEALPDDHETLFHGTSFSQPKYARPGYDRQQWSTFHLDRVAKPHHDVIGVIDADAWLISYVTRETIFAPDGRIILRAAKDPSHFHMDTVALGMPTPYDFMWIDRMPIWFWKSTFQNVRKYIASQWNTSSFDDAFRNFSVSRYSQFNIIAHYAVAMEPDKYVLVDHTDLNGTVSVGCNRCWQKDVKVGCCAVFNVSCDGVDSKTRTYSINRYYRYHVQWETDGNLADAHYRNVQRDLAILEKKNSTRVDRMREACMSYTRSRKHNPICSEAVPLPEKA